MKAQFLTTATMLAVSAGVLPATDPQLLNLIMPDAKVLAGVNVEQAKGTQFGQYILTQLQSQDAHMKALIALTGFDPTRDVSEVLVASDGNPQGKTGLALARGNFDVARITAAATVKGAASETYNGVTILEDPKEKAHGIAFLDGTIVAAGDLASVKGAIDRRGLAQPLPASVIVKINQLSAVEDAWGITTVAPASLVPASASSKKPGNPDQATAMLQNIQQASGGVKFGSQVVFTGEAQADTAQNATGLGDILKLLVNIAQMQTSQDPQAAALVKSIVVSTQGNTLKATVSLPQDQFQKILQPNKRALQLHVAK